MLDHTGHPVAAVALTFPASEVEGEERTALALQVSRSAARISRRIHGRDERPA